MAFVEFELACTHKFNECDDRVNITTKTIGTCAVAVLRGLKAKIHLDAAQSGKSSGEDMLLREENEGCGFFQSQADFDLEIKRLTEWADDLDDDEEKEISRAEIKKQEKNRAKVIAKPWFATGKIHDEDDRSAFNPTSV
ncbi:hypothetical protein CVT25_011025 [Psilocybe cyanescens]|uniref:Uncharacterized protein n=1 Tax=Psilocybe cyanescens TaxID=93625 RepID=A0A409WFY7_PSICY|nr:hypothetical protein CVT25_011025 [Psilocybe cyanescens]